MPVVLNILWHNFKYLLKVDKNISFLVKSKTELKIVTRFKSEPFLTELKIVTLFKSEPFSGSFTVPMYKVIYGMSYECNTTVLHILSTIIFSNLHSA